MAFFSMTDGDVNELPYVMSRLKAVTTGCEVSMVIFEVQNVVILTLILNLIQEKKCLKSNSGIR